MANQQGASLQQAAAQAAEDKDVASYVYGRIRSARDWFAVAVPQHIDPDQYIAVLLGLLQQNDKLREAAEKNFGSLLIAASECARLGLVPGETYHFVPFWNQARGIPEITGIIDYKGEIELIYRAGAVDSVHAEVVRENDDFVWKPGMVLPEHQIMANDSGQIGLSDAEARGKLTGVYAFARLRGGGVSQVVVMSKAQVGKHRAIAKTDQFWGPAWPAEGPWTENMWLKTAVHGLPTWVPTSPEYIAELWRAAAVVGQGPASVLPPAERPALMPPDAGPAPASMLRGRVEEARGAIRGASSRSAKQPEGKTARVKGMQHMHAQFGEAGLGHERDRAIKLAALGMLAAAPNDAEPPRFESANDLTDEQLGRANAALAEIIKQYADKAELRAALVSLAHAGGYQESDEDR